jgi:hypothetical protein
MAMLTEQTENTQATPEEAHSSSDMDIEKKRDRSSIGFPYNDLDDAVEIARAVHSNAGLSCSLSQLAAFVRQPISSGTFRLRVSNARTFGLTENERGGVKLTPLGRMIADPTREAVARADAFLHVPLYARIFEHHDGFTLPAAGALERFMREVGVSPKQTGKARQAFMRAARQAGFFAHGEDRLVRPAFPDHPGTRPIDAKEKGDKDQPGGGNAGGGDEPPRHPLIEGLFQSLPADGEPWTLEEAADWLQAAAYNLRFAYKLKGKITVIIDQQNSNPPSGHQP